MMKGKLKVKYSPKCYQLNRIIHLVLCLVLTVAFYDKDNKLITEEKEIFYSESYENDDTLSAIFFLIGGEVESIEITDYSKIKAVETVDVGVLAMSVFLSIALVWGFARAIYAIPLLIFCLCLSCKRYSYNNHDILVYAGRLHHYVKIDGVKYDQKSMLLSFSPIILQTTTPDGDTIEVSISSLTKRINLRINGMLQQAI